MGLIEILGGLTSILAVIAAWLARSRAAAKKDAQRANRELEGAVASARALAASERRQLKNEMEQEAQHAQNTSELPIDMDDGDHRADFHRRLQQQVRDSADDT